LKDDLVSVVIPTHNRMNMLKALLDSLKEHCDKLIHEVVVVDDSTISANFPRIEELKIIYVKLNDRVLISKAKNIGWKRTSCSYVWFIDDDNIVDNSTLRPMLEILKNRADIAALMPAVLYKRKPELVWVYATPLRKDRWGHILLGRNEVRNPLFENRLLNTDALPNSCLVRRSVLEQTGGFNEGLAVNSSSEFCLRIKQKGYKVLACTSSFIFHDVEPPGELGWWASHGAADPVRVKSEVKDWFQLMRILHANERFFTLKAVVRASGFLAPNFLAYVIRGRKKRKMLLKNQFYGFINGLRNVNK
jgi:GT2 family glycosyltransferase